MKRAVLSSLMALGTVMLLSAACAAQPSSHRAVDLLTQINSLLAMHQQELNALFDVRGTPDQFERAFFTDMSFMNDGRVRSFFTALHRDLQQGDVPRLPGNAVISYTVLQSINGTVTGVNYEYRSDGRNITLTRGTLDNGNVVRAVYNYDMNGRLLNTSESVGSRVVNTSSHRLGI
ncbi:MAG: hypothetical protein JXA20_09565 [Spirochaetes bacterium]|nr:hypothetical protein [Spirochaetota bacterium]